MRDLTEKRRSKRIPRRKRNEYGKKILEERRKEFSNEWKRGHIPWKPISQGNTDSISRSSTPFPLLVFFPPTLFAIVILRLRFPFLSSPFSFFLARVFCQEPSWAEASRTALKQKRSDVKCDYESCESSSRTRMLR